MDEEHSAKASEMLNTRFLTKQLEIKAVLQGLALQVAIAVLERTLEEFKIRVAIETTAQATTELMNMAMQQKG